MASRRTARALWADLATIRRVRFNMAMVQLKLPDAVKEQIEQWHRGFPAELVREHLAELRSQRDDLNEQIRALEEEYDRWQAFKLPSVQSDGHATAQAEPIQRGRPVASIKARRYRCVLELLTERHPEEVSNPEIRARLVGEGYFTDDEKGRKGVDALLFQMNKSGLIRRHGRGSYKLRPDEGGESASTEVQSP